jgi:multidrug efflux pump subunit AcrA (membrane-fusion protein)
MGLLPMLCSRAICDKEPLMRLTHGQNAHATFGIRHRSSFSGVSIPNRSNNMNRVLTFANLIGVLALAGLCFFQWHTGSAMGEENYRLTKSEYGLTEKVSDQQKSLSEDASELQNLRDQLSAAQASAKADEAKLASATEENKQLAAQRTQLKASLDQWVSAVAARDAAIKQAGAQVQKISTERNEVQLRLNDLITKYNQLAKQ